MQAGAWRLRVPRPDTHTPLASPLYPLGALLALLLVFQLLLRPGIRF